LRTARIYFSGTVLLILFGAAFPQECAGREWKTKVVDDMAVRPSDKTEPARGRGINAALLKAAEFAEFVKIQHSVFALPFALLSAAVAGKNGLSASQILWIVAAMVGARSSAMGFNRIADRHLDALNPRTTGRSLPSGRLSLLEAWVFVIASTALFVFSAAKLNRLALMLSPAALAVIWGYSFTKRFTALSHLVLGLALGIAPAGAWIAIRGSLELPAVILSAAVIFWVAGFDIIYACQDYSFDKRHGLHSIPARFGIATALKISEAMHIVTLLLFVWLKYVVGFGWIYTAALLAAGALLFVQHRMVRPDDLSRADAAFFTANGFLSLAFSGMAILDIYV